MGYARRHPGGTNGGHHATNDIAAATWRSNDIELCACPRVCAMIGPRIRQADILSSPLDFHSEHL
jgi:hypothetical protein